MIVHVFKYTEWRRVPDGMGCVDWDCDFCALVVHTDGRVDKRPYNSQSDQDRLEAEFPFRLKHTCYLNEHNDTIDVNSDTEKLKENFPLVWASLNKWMPFKDRRLKLKVQDAHS